jgi:hypothetical protein
MHHFQNLWHVTYVCPFFISIPLFQSYHFIRIRNKLLFKLDQTVQKKI